MNEGTQNIEKQQGNNTGALKNASDNRYKNVMDEKRARNSQYHDYHHPEGYVNGRHKIKKKNRALQLTIIILICIIILCAMGVATYAVMRNMGEQKLQQQATTAAPTLDLGEEMLKEVNPTATLEEGQIYYQGQVYQYNSDIKTFAIMGIDTMGTVEELLAEELGGQSDMNFLAVLNPHTQTIQMIAINRNTMTEIQRFATDGTYIDTVEGQITLQHAYGTGGTDSCEKMVSAIDNVMYMVPIHGYFAMNMGAISKLNDAVGGVELTALEDIAYKDTDIREGEKVTLLGEDAFWYTKYRDTKIVESANDRLDRQKQYLTAFVQKTKQMVKNDLSLPLDLYQIVKDYSVTDVTVDEMTYLVSTAAGYSFSGDNIYTVPGETITGGTYDEFYVDNATLYDMIVDIFYEPVDNE